MNASMRLCTTHTLQLYPKLFSTSTAATGESGLKAILPAVVYNNAGLAIFSCGIGGIVGMIWRTSAASSNFNTLRDELSENVLLDRHELEDLMYLNRSFSVDTYAAITQSLSTAFPLGRASYDEFVAHVQGYLESPLKSGHLLDRVVLNRAVEEEDVRFLMTLLALAMETDTLEDRARSLFSVFSQGGNSNADGDLLHTVDSKMSKILSKDNVIKSIEYLHVTQQIPVEKKIIKTDREYPVQTYVEASASDLLKEAALETSLEEAGPFNEDQFVELILGKAVCAWGSCHPNRSGSIN